MVVAGPDVYMYHQEDTERYILANLNIVSVAFCLDCCSSVRSPTVANRFSSVSVLSEVFVVLYSY